MDIYETFRRNNFLLIYAVLLMHILQMLKFTAFPSSLQCVLYSLVCIYVGSTRSLIFYSVKKEDRNNDEEKLANNENSLLSLRAALSIPVVATGSLLLAYLALVNQQTWVNTLLQGYFCYVSTLVLKKYLYQYSKTNQALNAFDFPLGFL